MYFSPRSLTHRLDRLLHVILGDELCCVVHAMKGHIDDFDACNRQGGDNAVEEPCGWRFREILER